MKKPVLHLVKLDNIPIFQQLCWEEALLRADDRNWCLINSGSPPAIVMGISGKSHLLLNQEKMVKNPIPLIRRFSGGGTVVVDENTLFMTFICQSSAINIPPYPRSLMEWSANLYAPLFKSLPFSLRENDYVLGEHKWGGNAQSIIKGRWLHHSSLLWDYCSDRMDYLLLPSKTPHYRKGRTHADFLCRLCEFWENKTQFQNQLMEQLENRFTLREMTMEEIKKISELPHRKSTSFEIIYGV